MSLLKCPTFFTKGFTVESASLVTNSHINCINNKNSKLRNSRKSKLTTFTRNNFVGRYEI